VEATCFTHEGIDAIIPAFKAGKELASQVQIAIVSAPTYSVSLVTKEIEEGILLVQSVIDKVKETLEKRGGSLVIKVAPKALAAN
jgi:translation initiation factor 2 subunit 1